MVKIKEINPDGDKRKMEVSTVKNLSDFLFQDDDFINEDSLIDLNQKDIERMHTSYVQSLILIYQRMKHQYSRYLKFQTPEHLQIL